MYRGIGIRKRNFKIKQSTPITNSIDVQVGIITNSNIIERANQV
jgi:hypothetical protein